MTRRAVVPALVPRSVSAAAPLALLLAVALSGCFQFETLLRLNADGSGEIEETLLLNDFLLSMMQGDSTGSGLFDAADLAARADSFGTGVRFVRVDSLAEGGFSGYRAVYAFDDVNTVRLVPGDGGPAGMGGGEAAGPSAFSAVEFAYEPARPGTPGRLRLVIPRGDEGGEGDGAPIDPDTLAAKTEEVRQQVQEAAVLRGFLEGARLRVAVALPGAVAETNARYVEEGVVTLADLAFGAFLDLMGEDPELAARLDLAETAEDREAAIRALNEHPGLRFEPAEEVVVTFAE